MTLRYAAAIRSTVVSRPIWSLKSTRGFRPSDRIAFRLIMAFLAVFLSAGSHSEVFAQGKSLSKSLAAEESEVSGAGKSVSERSSPSLPKLPRSLSGIGGLSNPYQFTAKYEAEQSGLRGRIHVSAVVEDGYYISSTTQPKGGPTATFVSAVSDDISVTGPFLPDRDPELTFDMAGFEGVRVEKFYDGVVWTAPVTFNEQITNGSKTFELKIDGQVCKKGACIPIIGATVKASFQGFYAGQAPASGSFRDSAAHAQWVVSIEPATIKPGQSAMLSITGKPDQGYHLYPLERNAGELTQKTLIALTQKGSLLAGSPETNSSIVTLELLKGTLSTSYHQGDATWSIPIHVPLEKVDGIYPISGVVGYQTCQEEECDQPMAFRFSGELNVSSEVTAGVAKPVNFSIAAVDYDVAEQAGSLGDWVDEKSVQTSQATMAVLPLLSYFSLAMLGGLILNFMPCVLPVIGLKVMSFVGESAGDRRRSSMLNLWYSAGLVSVFLVLAIVTIAIRSAYGVTLGWGQQFQVFELRVGIIILLFAMALSFLGVWEIPIPGFATSSQSADLARKEGPFGAFSKGIITTIVATPCSGPFLGAVFALSLTQPPWVIVLMYVGVGLGMAMPYLLVAAYPQTLRFLPKPGAWMETLKQVLAFPLLLSVVWFMTTIENDYRIAVLSLLVMVGFACWMIGRVPVYAESVTKIQSWGVALAICLLAGWVSFRYLGPREHLIDWRPYNETELRELVAAGQPVMIDFTASWCSTCQLNLIQAIETEDVAAAIKAHNVVPMIADWSDRNKTIADKLQQLNSNSIPVLAIYPPSADAAPIVLTDVLLKQTVVNAIKDAAAEIKVASASDPHDTKMSLVDFTTSLDATKRLPAKTTRSVSDKQTSLVEESVDQ